MGLLTVQIAEPWKQNTELVRTPQTFMKIPGKLDTLYRFLYGGIHFQVEWKHIGIFFQNNLSPLSNPRTWSIYWHVLSPRSVSFCHYVELKRIEGLWLTVASPCTMRIRSELKSSKSASSTKSLCSLADLLLVSLQHEATAWKGV